MPYYLKYSECMDASLLATTHILIFHMGLDRTFFFLPFYLVFTVGPAVSQPFSDVIHALANRRRELCVISLDSCYGCERFYFLAVVYFLGMGLYGRWLYFMYRLSDIKFRIVFLLSLFGALSPFVYLYR